MFSNTSVSDGRLIDLRSLAIRNFGEGADILVSTSLIFRITNELIDARDELLRLHMAESVEQTLARELDDEDEDHLAFKWPDNSYLASDMLSHVYKPAFPCKETVRLLGITASVEPSQEADGRRLPRVD